MTMKKFLHFLKASPLMKKNRHSQFPIWCHKCSKNISNKQVKYHHNKHCDGLEVIKSVESVENDLLFSMGYLTLDKIENDFKLGCVKLDKVDNVFKVIRINK